MNDRQFTGLLVLLVPQITAEIVHNEGLSEHAAIESFYCSRLCEALENEATKLWHLSPKALYELYRQEMTTGNIIYPEEA